MIYWLDELLPDGEARGMISLLKCEEVTELGPVGPKGHGKPPSGTFGGVELQMAGKEPNHVLYIPDKLNYDSWVSALAGAFTKYCSGPVGKGKQLSSMHH